MFVRYMPRFLAYAIEFVLKGYQELLESLKKAVDALDKNIHAMLKRHPELEQNMKYAESISGVGILTAVVLVAETNNFAYVESIVENAHT